MNQLKELISFANSKVGKNTAVFNMSPAYKCPAENLGLCQYSWKCYAKKAEWLYPGVPDYRNRQMKYWLKCTPEQFAEEFMAIKRRIKTKYLRFNESGDFHTQDCVDKANKIAELINVRVYTYTKRIDLDFSKLNRNFIVNGSGFMVTNNYEVVTGEIGDKKFICKNDCTICNLCKVNGHKVIYQKMH